MWPFSSVIIYKNQIFYYVKKTCCREQIGCDICIPMYVINKSDLIN